MKRLLRLICLLLCLMLVPILPGCADEQEAAPIVRVLLRRLALTDRIDLTLNGAYAAGDGAFAMAFPRGAKVTVQVREGQLYLFYQGMSMQAGSRLTFARTGTNQTDHLRIGGASSEYPGDLTLTVSGGVLQPVLAIGMEDYLLGVIPHEMSDSFPLEALKAQAVCARTYAMSKLGGSGTYDVVDTTNDQVFKGIDRTDANAARAIAETAGVVGVYKGKLVVCYYSASNGGQTELPVNVWGGEGAGCYAMVDDPYDLENPASLVLKASVAKESPVLPDAVLSAIFEQAVPTLDAAGFVPEEDCFRIDRIDSIALGDPTLAAPSRRYTTLTLTFTASGQKLIPYVTPQPEEEDFSLFATSTPEPTQTPAPTSTPAPTYSDFIPLETPITVTIPVFPNVIRALKLSVSGADNEMLTVEETDTGFTLMARRYGHGVGMSQRGAQWMADKYGATYDQILGFYYPGMQLKKSPAGVRPLPTMPAPLAATPAPPATPTPRPTLMPTDTGNLPEGAWIASVEGVAENSSLNLRAEPNQASDILMRLYRHQVLIVLEACEEDGWVHVCTDVAEGYVMLEFLEKVE